MKKSRAQKLHPKDQVIYNNRTAEVMTYPHVSFIEGEEFVLIEIFDNQHGYKTVTHKEIK